MLSAALWMVAIWVMLRATDTCEMVRPEFSPRRTLEVSVSSATMAKRSAPPDGTVPRMA